MFFLNMNLKIILTLPSLPINLFSLMQTKLLILLFFALAFITCKDKIDPNPVPVPNPVPGSTALTATPQRINGNPALGEAFIKTGNFAYAGIPLRIFRLANSAPVPNELGRTGENATIAYDYTAVDAFNGVKVVSANCLSCHASYLDNQFVMGLGNTMIDYTSDNASLLPFLDLIITNQYGANSPEYAAYAPFRTAVKAVSPNLIMPTRGVNAADKLAAVLAAHRNKTDLTWLPTPQFAIPTEIVPTDVPAWWLLRKKNALYYNANGQGDFAKTLMAAALLTIKDSSYARTIDASFIDVAAYLKQLKAPAYPKNIDPAKAMAGKPIFEKNCAKCHGTYDAPSTYPNLLIDVATIQTDPTLAQMHQTYSQYNGWFNESWFGQGSSKGHLQPTNGYIAPPLDGVWATAPYLHNGSVPDLFTLLKSSERPPFWTRSFTATDYNYTQMGWNYTKKTAMDTGIYDTTKKGYANTGHTYGDFLTDTERYNLIEYLKGL
jgi:mono/diheme cytochrome c family protein